MIRGRRSQVGREVLLRSTQGRLVAGVCAGIATRYNMDVTLVRLAALLLLLASGLGLLLYIAGWLLIPSADLDLPAERDLSFVARSNVRSIQLRLREWGAWLVGAWRDRADLSRQRPAPVNRRWLAYLLITCGAMIFLYSVGVFSWLGTARSFGLAIVAIGAAVLASNASALRRQGDQDSDR